MRRVVDGGDDVVCAIVRQHVGVPVLLQAQVVGPEAVDVLETLCRVERERVGRGAYDGAIAVVQGEDIQVHVTADERELEWEPRKRPELRAGELAEWGEVEVVDCGVELPCYDLYSWLHC